MTKKEFAPVTPGEMLKEEFLAEYGFSQNQLAKAIGISPNRITEIVNNRRRITADTALRRSAFTLVIAQNSGSGHEASFDFAKRKSMRAKIAQLIAYL